MLISTAIQQVHLISQGNTDYPSSGEDDYSLSLALLNNAINIWENQEGIDWAELFNTETGTITSGDFDISLSSNFKRPAGQLKIGGLLYNFNSPNEQHLTQQIDSSYKHFTVTGIQGSKVLNIYPTPGSDIDGATFYLPKYRFATTYSTGVETDHIDMSDPYFAIHYAIGQIKLEDDPTGAGVHQQIANQKLSAMRIANDSKPIGSIENNHDLTYSGFGV